MLWSVAAPGEPRYAGASGVAFSGGLLYVTQYSATSGASSLSVVDPASRAIVGSVADPRLDGAATLVVVGNLAYVTGVQNRTGLTNANRLTIVDVSTPRAPRIVGSVQDSVKLYGAYGVQVVGDVAYVAAQGCVPSVCSTTAVGNRLVVIDVSDATNPRVVGTVADPNAATYHLVGIAAVGSMVYGTAFRSSTLTVFDASDPANPTIVGSVTDPRLKWANDVVVRGRYAYVTDQSSTTAQLVVVDIADPANPTVVGSVLDAANLNQAYYLALRGHYAFVASYVASSLTIIDVADPVRPQVVAARVDSSVLGKADSVDVAGGTAYVAAFCTTPNSGCSSPTTGALTTLDVTPYTALDLTSGPPAQDSSRTPSIAFGSPQSGATFTCSLDGGAASPCSSPFVPTAPLANGPHTLAVTASTDPTPATWAWVLDPVAPDVRLTAPASGSTQTGSPAFSGVAGMAVGDRRRVTVRVYPGPSASGPPVETLSATAAPSTGGFSVPASPALAPGAYTAQASQSDAAGNTGTSSASTFIVPGAAAAPQNAGPPPSASPGPGPHPVPPPVHGVTSCPRAPATARDACVRTALARCRRLGTRGRRARCANAVNRAWALKQCRRRKGGATRRRCVRNVARRYPR